MQELKRQFGSSSHISVSKSVRSHKMKRIPAEANRALSQHPAKQTAAWKKKSLTFFFYEKKRSENAGSTWAADKTLTENECQHKAMLVRAWGGGGGCQTPCHWHLTLEEELWSLFCALKSHIPAFSDVWLAFILQKSFCYLMQFEILWKFWGFCGNSSCSISLCRALCCHIPLTFI